MAENKKISELEPLEGLSGEEHIPVELDGKNYTITPKQIASSKLDAPVSEGVAGQLLEKTADGTAWTTLNIENVPNVVSSTTSKNYDCPNTVKGDYSFSYGRANTNNGEYTYSFGYGNTANSWSFAFGYFSKANNAYTIALGNNCESNNKSEVSLGQYNRSRKKSDNYGDENTAFSIGIGTGNLEKKNAQEVMQNGDFYVYGIGGYDGTNPYEAKSLQEVVNAGGSDFENLPTFDSITGQEKVIVVKDGKTQGLVTLTQIRQVVLPGYTYEDLSMDKFPDLEGGIDDNGQFAASTLMRNEIPVKKGQVVVISLVAIASNAMNIAQIGFTTESLTGLNSKDAIPYAGNGGKYDISIGETVTLPVPDDAEYLVINSYERSSSSAYKCTWEIQIGELIEEKLDDLNERVNRLEEQSAIAPASLDSVSRDEFDALKSELTALKEKMQ